MQRARGARTRLVALQPRRDGGVADVRVNLPPLLLLRLPRRSHARAARDIAATLHDELIPPREETPDEPFMRM